MTKQEIQKLIDNKDWEGLIERNFLMQGLLKFTDTVFSKDFIFDFILKEKQLFIDYEIELLLKRKEELGIIFEKDEWIKFYYIISEQFPKAVNQKIVGIQEGRDNNHLILWLDNKIYNNFSTIKNKYGFTSKEVRPQFFENFSKEECRILFTRIFQTDIFLEFKDCDESIVLDYFTTKEAIKIGSKFNIAVGLIFQHLPFQEFIGLFQKYRDNDNSIWLQYFQKNTEQQLSDKFVESYIPEIHLLINNLSREQVIKYIKYFSNSNIFNRKDIDIEIITKKFGNNKIDLTLFKFFTEEEIRENPNYFDPTVVVSTICQYVSEDTFKLLNKTWSKRQKWNKMLVNFNKIITDIAIGHTINSRFTQDNLLYLKEKTSVSNKDFINTIVKLSGMLKDKKINKFTKILEKIK